MTKLKFISTIEVEYSTATGEISPSAVKKQLTESIEWAVGSGLLGDEFEVNSWFVNVKYVDPAVRETRVEISYPIMGGRLTASYSADGPALTLDLTTFEPDDNERAQQTIVQEATRLLREVYHRYLNNLSKGL